MRMLRMGVARLSAHAVRARSRVGTSAGLWAIRRRKASRSRTPVAGATKALQNKTSAWRVRNRLTRRGESLPWSRDRMSGLWGVRGAGSRHVGELPCAVRSGVRWMICYDYVVVVAGRTSRTSKSETLPRDLQVD
ncbi:hypothetical protein BC628DRAFT_139790 [Trametes gibbosa]|nr:hypothetical protein BC628DRAFT_139790 [Trametes gibbosa]